MPVDTVNRIVPQLIKHGKIIRPGIGISVLPDAITTRWRVRGVVIRQVTPAGAAARVGLTGLRSAKGGQVVLGDVVTALGGEAVRTVDDLLTILDRHQVGDQVTVQVMRKGEERTVSLTLQAVE